MMSDQNNNHHSGNQLAGQGVPIKTAEIHEVLERLGQIEVTLRQLVERRTIKGSN